MQLRNGWVLLVMIALACGSLFAQTNTPKLTLRQFDAMSDGDKDATMISRVNGMTVAESKSNPEQAGEIWALYYPELVNYGSVPPKSTPDGKAIFWKMFFEIKESGRDLNSLDLDELITAITLKNMKDPFFPPNPNQVIPPAPPVQALTWAELQEATGEKRTALMQRPMHEMVAHVAVKNPARAKFIQLYFFAITKKDKTSVGMLQFNKELAKYQSQLQKKTVDPASVRLDRIAEKNFEDWEATLEEYFWVAARVDAGYTFMLTELKQRQKKLQAEEDRIDCHAIPLSDGRKAYLNKNDVLVDGKGKPLQGAFLAQARAFDFSSPTGERYLGKCLKDHGLSPEE